MTHPIFARRRRKVSVLRQQVQQLQTLIHPMHTILVYLIARLGEPSTWRGLFALLTALGISLHPEQMAAITSLGLALIGAVNVFRKEQAVKLLIGGLCVLSMTSCGLTSEQWKNIALTTGKEIGKQLPATAMRAYATEMSKPSGKQPVAVNPAQWNQAPILLPEVQATPPAEENPGVLAALLGLFN